MEHSPDRNTPQEKTAPAENGKVYVVTCGAYSDYQIVACFLRKEQAEIFVNMRARTWDCDELVIEEYEIRDGTDLTDGAFFAFVSWDIKSNTIIQVEYLEKDDFRLREPSRRKDLLYGQRFHFWLRADNRALQDLMLPTPSDLLLKKIAQDRFALFKAAKEGVV